MDLCFQCGTPCSENCVHSTTLCNDCDERMNYPLDYVYEIMEKFPKTRKFKHCLVEQEVSSLHMYTNCIQCQTKVKLWSFGAPKEMQDILLLAKRWLIEAGEIPSK